MVTHAINWAELAHSQTFAELSKKKRNALVVLTAVLLGAYFALPLSSMDYLRPLARELGGPHAHLLLGLTVVGVAWLVTAAYAWASTHVDRQAQALWDESLRRSRIESITARCADVWGDTLEGRLCRVITGHVLEQASDDSRLSFETIHRLARDIGIDSDVTVMRSVQYLAGHDIHLLDLGFEFAEDGHSPVAVDPKVVMAAESGSAFLHPRTRAVVPDYAGKLFLYFEASAIAKRLSQPKDQ